jgi:hypothetical protein
MIERAGIANMAKCTPRSPGQNQPAADNGPEGRRGAMMVTPLSLLGTIEQVSSALSPALVQPAAIARIGQVARGLPAALTNQVYFECRMADPGARVDLIIRVGRSGAGILAGRSRAAAVAAGLAATPSWRRLAAFARRWLDEDWLRTSVDSLWLEFDLPGPDTPGALSSPRVFVALARGSLAGTAGAAGLLLRLAALLRLDGRSPPGALVTACIGHPAVRDRLRYVGVDPSSPEPSLRLCITSAAVGELQEQLGLLGNPAGAGRVPSCLAALHAPSLAMVANVDVTDRVVPGVGVELGLARSPQVSGRIGERDFLDRLVAVGLSSPDRARSLSTWPGHSVTVFGHELWPSLVLRRVNHIKLRLQEGQLSEAKVYLCFIHGFWRRPATPTARG